MRGTEKRDWKNVTDLVIKTKNIPSLRLINFHLQRHSTHSNLYALKSSISESLDGIIEPLRTKLKVGT